MSVAAFLLLFSQCLQAVRGCRRVGSPASQDGFLAQVPNPEKSNLGGEPARDIATSASGHLVARGKDGKAALRLRV